MSKDVEDVNFTRKSKTQNKADEGAKEIGKGRLPTSYWQTLFTDKIGKLKDTKIKLHINNKIPPVAQAERRIQFALRKKVQKEI